MTDPSDTTAPFALPPCLRCGSTDTIEIVYGYPDTEMSAAAERGEIALGGCLVGPEAPEFECRGCHLYLPWVPAGML